MTERGLPLADGASACPFVAFEDDRDERASVPDRRHRCYAESRPAPRALAHQEAYCLSSAFPVCPTFQDWARREAARARDAADAAAASPGGRAAASTAGATGSAGAGAGAGAGAVGAAAAGAAAAGAAALAGSADLADDHDAPGEPAPAAASSASAAPAEADADSDLADADDAGVRRNPPRDWAAPPPWLASSEGGGSRPAAGTPPFLGHRTPEPGQGLAGSAADWLAGGEAPAAALGASAGASAAGMGAAVGRGRSDSIEDPRQTNADQASPAGDEQPRRPTRRSRAYEQHLGGTDGPDWERPRRYEAYPTIKTRVGMPNLSRPALMIGAIAIAAIALFFLPALLGIGGTGSPAGPSLAPSGAAASQSLLPTEVPAPTPVLYTIKKNDILSKIASAHGVSLADLLAANPKIKDPNKITEGQVITIPVPSSAPDLGGGSAQPSPSAS